MHELLEHGGPNPPDEMAKNYPHQLSGGQRQRVAIARALAVDPEIILADEPISMLDVSIRMGVLNLMEQLKEERGIGFLYITHDIASARYIGDDTMVMYAGHMVEGAESDRADAATRRTPTPSCCCRRCRTRTPGLRDARSRRAAKCRR